MTRRGRTTLVLLATARASGTRKNLFTGWVDVDLSDAGEAEAGAGGALLAEAGLLPDVLHTSVLRRAIRTANDRARRLRPALDPGAPLWRLNERHYGALQGKDKKQTLAEYGEEQFMLWRRSYDVPPPPLADDDEFCQAGDPRYATLPPELRPRTECLQGRRRPDAAVLVRRDRARPARRRDRAGDRARQLAARAGQAPRRHLRRRTSPALNIPTGIPLRVRARRRPAADAAAAARYLDPEAAAAAIEAVANQGR